LHRKVASAVRARGLPELSTLALDRGEGVDHAEHVDRDAHRGPFAFRALALDYDGTLTTGPRPADDVLTAIQAARESGLRVILVTGRILAELRTGFSEVDQWFDAIVAENGAVLSGPFGHFGLAPPISPVLASALAARGVPVRSGEVLLAVSADHAIAAMEETHRIERDYQVLYNRSEIMILPAGVTKATGLQFALSRFGLSNHVTVAVGDAENDHALLQWCEVGVAVANAVGELKANADLVLEHPEGSGILELLSGPLLTGDAPMRPSGRDIAIGRLDDGSPATLPASHRNVLITGASRSGKSYVAGLYAERLIEATYTLLVIDYEGDHIGLRTLPGVVVVGGDRHLPEPAEVCTLLRQFVTVVVDLSIMNHRDQDAYVEALATSVDDLREAKGLPHWLVIDEAHRWPPPIERLVRARSGGCCLVTWRPDQLGATSTTFDVAVVVASPAGAPREVRDFVDRWNDGLSMVQPIPVEAHSNTVMLLNRADGSAPRMATLDPRGIQHVRHWHKYSEGSLPRHLRFEFRRPSGQPTGEVASNLTEFESAVASARDDVLTHHLMNRDFSRWALEALQDHSLATDLAEIEGGFAIVQDVAVSRSRVCASMHTRTNPSAKPRPQSASAGDDQRPYLTCLRGRIIGP